MSSEESTNCSKYSNIFQILRTREIGPLSGVNAERDYCQMIASKKELINEYSLNTYLSGNIHEVNYIRGTPSFILGVWTADANRFITHQPLVVDRSLLYYKVYTHFLTDLCDGPYGSVIYTFNRIDSQRGGIVGFQLHSDEFPVYSRYIHKKLSNFPIYCCSSTTDSAHLAIGSHKKVIYYDHVSDEGYEFPVMNESRAHTISFNHSSNLMVTGIRTGYVSLRDMRMKKNLKNIRVSYYCVNESYFLEPDQIIAAGPENTLCRIDLRMNKVVREYIGHVTTTRKSALSVANNMLCVAGADNVIRIWHLSGGRPIHEIKPFIRPDNNVKGWLFKEADKTYLYHFEAAFRKTFLIT